MGHRIARLDEVGPPSGAAPVAELGAADARPAPAADVARLDEGGGQAVPPREASPIARPEPGRAATGDPSEDRRRRGREAGDSRPQGDAADGSVPGGSVPDGGRVAGAEVATGAGADRRRGGGRGRSGRVGDAAGRPAREPAARRGGPKQIDPDADPVAAAREICLRLLTDRARTRHELAQALRQRGVPDDAAGSVLERFDEVGLIDDAAFAGQYVRSRHTFRGLARRAIAMELRRKGVDGEVAEEALEEVDAHAEARRARELVDRKLRSLTVDSPEQRSVAARRLVGMLARKGYGAGTAYGVVKEALAAHGAEADELGSEPVD
jgi:regulatory protein